jgi:hypothetical protein
MLSLRRLLYHYSKSLDPEKGLPCMS